jgi:hypothetical protein
MEILLELILGFIFEGAMEGMKSKAIPIWLRILCALLFIAVFLVAIGSIGVFSVFIMWDTFYHIPSVLLLLLDFALIAFAVKKVKSIVEKKKRI